MAGSISLATKPPPIAIATKLVIFASFSAPSKPAFVKFSKIRRGNTLRPKILTKPYSPSQNPKSPVVEPLEIPAVEQNDAIISVAPSRSGNDNRLLEVTGKKFLARYGLYFVGAFVFQTVLAVWIIGNSNDDNERDSQNGLKLDREVSLLNEVQFEERVEEIRAMAARARKEEKNKISDSRSGNKSAVEREIGKRLSKLKKSSKSGITIGSESKTGNGSLSFKKKFRFKGYSGNSGEEIEIVNGGARNSRKKFDDPKGFLGSTKNETSSEGMINGARFEGPKGFGGSAKNKASKGNKREEKPDDRENEASRLRRSRTGVIQERSSESKTSRDSKTGADRMWWRNLHHIFVIMMQRGSDPDGPAGLFTVGSSYAVAFADRVDATNFCFLLETLFEDLGDVSVDIVPMSAKELEMAVESGNWKVIVVKKRQIQMYAGQPFEEVEIALKALVEEARSS